MSDSIKKEPLEEIPGAPESSEITEQPAKAEKKPENLNIRERLRAAYGENQPITGEYDEALAVKCLNGTFVGRAYSSVTEFKGIPFAKPPVGELRWKRPQPVGKSDRVFEAFFNGKTPIQTEWPTERASYYPGGEDCLYLNVWVNRECSEQKKPVMVFLHGGSYGWGGTADPLYDGKNFVRANSDIVLVSVGYRIGLMGFVDLSSLEGGSDYPDAPNLGILDQIEALRWIQENIAAFGGDPGNVTVFGESAGGGTVSLLPIIAEAKGLFKRVIAQSGSVALTSSKEECREFTRRLVKAVGTRKMSELMALTEDELKKINVVLNDCNNFPQRDGKLIPEDPYAAYKSGMTRDVEMIIGTNADETNYWIGELGGIVPFRFSIPVKFENDMKMLKSKDKKRVAVFMSQLKGHKIWRMAEFYNEIMFRLPAVKQSELHSLNGGKAYMYYWTEPSSLRYCGACHAVELAYVFGNLDETIFTGDRPDEELAAEVMNMWAGFARSGNPSTERHEWEEYDPEKRATMVISKQPEVQNDVLKLQRVILSPLLKYMINPSYATLDFNVPFVRKTIGMAVGIIAAAAVAGAAAVRALKKL